MKQNRHRNGVSPEEALRTSFEQMDAASRAAVRRRVLATARQTRSVGFLASMPQRVTAAAVAFTTLAGGVAYAANESMPGDALYAVKRAGEDALVALLPSGSLERHLLVGIAARRAAEVAQLEGEGASTQMQQMLNEFHRAVHEITAAQGALDEGEAARIRENAETGSGTTQSRIEEMISPTHTGTEEQQQTPYSGALEGEGTPHQDDFGNTYAPVPEAENGGDTDDAEHNGSGGR